MKTADYLSKYGLDRNERVPQKPFLFDLTNEFLSYLETTKTAGGEPTIKGYDQAIRVICQKWDAISRKMKGPGLPEGMWKYWYATFLARMRDELFPSEMQQRRAEQEFRKQMWEDRKRFREEMFGFRSFFGGFGFGDWLGAWLKDLAPRTSSVVDLELFGLAPGATPDDIKEAYRKQVLAAHPDKGGDPEQFMKLTEARNRLLAVAS